MSAPAVAALVTRLEREAVTANQVRHLPISTPRDARGALRFGVEEIALVRLAVRLSKLYRREGWPQWKVRAALLYLGPIVHMGLRVAERLAVVVNPRDGSAFVRAANAGLSAGVVVPLDSLLVNRDDLRAGATGRERASEAEGL